MDPRLARRLLRHGPPAPRRPARRPSHCSRAAPHHHGGLVVRRRARPDRPDERGDRPRHRPPAHPPRRAGPHAARGTGCAGPARRTARCRPGRLGRRRRRRGIGDRCAGRPAGRRRPGTGPLPGRRPGAAARRGPGRPQRRRHPARRPAPARRPRGRRRPGARAGPRCRRGDLGAGLVARLAMAGVRRPRGGGDQPDRRDATGGRSARRGHRAPVRRPVADLHHRRPLPRLPVPAQFRPDLRPALVRPDLPGLVAPVPRAAGRPHPGPVRGEPGRTAHLARRREGRRPARPRTRRPVRGGRRERPSRP